MATPVGRRCFPAGIIALLGALSSEPDPAATLGDFLNELKASRSEVHDAAECTDHPQRPLATPEGPAPSLIKDASVGISAHFAPGAAWLSPFTGHRAKQVVIVRFTCGEHDERLALKSEPNENASDHGSLPYRQLVFRLRGR